MSGIIVEARVVDGAALRISKEAAGDLRVIISACCADRVPGLYRFDCQYSTAGVWTVEEVTNKPTEVTK